LLQYFIGHNEGYHVITTLKKAALSAKEEAVIQAFKERVFQAFPDEVLEVRLFGSRARGEGCERSDVDLAVLVREESGKLRRVIYDIAADLFLETEVNLSPLVLSNKRYDWLKSIERGVALAIDREGISL
jgi:predicted nucleotidyltransferase